MTSSLARTLTLALPLFIPLVATSVTPPRTSHPAEQAENLRGLRYRLVGPFRGGRASTVAGVPGDPRVYYFGGPGGGVWKTTNGGTDWTPIFDDQPVAAIGSVAVAPSDPNILYVGTGDPDLRNNVSHGNGVYKSTDAGRTWRHLGLSDTRHIARVVVHPTDPDVAFVAALGHAFGPNEERGVFRTRDGGLRWEKVLFVDQDTGAVDISIDPVDPSVLFAALWQARRMPWSFTSGGTESALYRSSDSGTTWTRLDGNGLPEAPLGRIGVAVSPADRQRVYAIVEAPKGGMYRSDDGGRSWELVNESRMLTQRAWFFMNVIPDPRSPDTVYVLNINLLRSTDGGRTFEALPQNHVDNQALWIAPEDPLRMISGNDGGANVSVDGGRTWTRSDNNQPTGQFYHVATDSRFPYYLYGGQQDYDTLAIASRSDYGGITDSDWYPLVQCEMGFAVPDPRDPFIVYGGCTDGGISRYDHRTRRSQSIEPWPETYIGHGAEAARYRFQWTAPILISRFDPSRLYHAANVVFRSADEGMTWTVISPDLTRDDRSKQRVSGGPITKDNVGGEYYNTIFALAESPVRRDLLWTGTDDGLVHLTRNGGERWENVTPAALPEWSRVSVIEPSPHDPATAYIAVDRHMLDDYSPYIYRTSDYGRSWTQIATGMPDGTFVRAVREDPVRRGLLYAGTETGVFVSLNGGAEWRALQLNMPVAPVHDLVVKERDLIVATHGRAFWILDDLTPLREWARPAGIVGDHLFPPSPAYRIRGDFSRPRAPAGANPPEGAIVYYRLATRPTAAVELSIVDAAGAVIRSFSSRPPTEAQTRDPFSQSSSLSEEPGLNRFVWDLRHPPHRPIPDHVLFWHPPHAPPAGPLALPGAYVVRLTIDARTYSAPLEIRPDPRLSNRPDKLRSQLELHLRIRDTLSNITDAVLRIRAHRAAGIRNQEVAARLSAIEQALIEPRMRTGGDAFHYPLKLDNKLVVLMGIVANSDTAPTRSSYELYEDLSRRVRDLLNELNELEATLR